MINGNLDEFIENLYYGQEMWIKYNEKIYFIQGFLKNNLHHLEVIDHDNNNYLWIYENKESQICVDKFLEASIFGGNKLLDIENEIIWIDGSEI